jgi:hypothetical protein
VTAQGPHSLARYKDIRSVHSSTIIKHSLKLFLDNSLHQPTINRKPISLVRLKMYALSFFIATLSLVTAAPSVDHRQVIAVASVDRSSAGRCTGTICNVAGSGDLHSGCNAITDQCQASLKLNYANTGCKGVYFQVLLLLSRTLLIPDSHHLERLSLQRQITFRQRYFLQLLHSGLRHQGHLR